MDAGQAKHLVRSFILSGGTNPPESDFKATMGMLKNSVLDDLAGFCDRMKANVEHTQRDPVGGPVCDRVKAIIVASKG